MATPAKLPYVFYTLEVDEAYWRSLTKGNTEFDAGSRGYSEAVNTVANRFGLPSQLEPGNFSAYESSLDSGIGSWLSQRQFRPGLKRIYTEPLSSNKNKKRYVIAEIRNL